MNSITAANILNKYDQEAINLVREFRVQAANTVVCQFEDSDIVETSNEDEVNALARAYSLAGCDELIFKSLDDFDSILSALEVLEKDPNCYECKGYQVYLGPVPAKYID